MGMRCSEIISMIRSTVADAGVEWGLASVADLGAKF
jgi:hypothetical protein